MRGQRAGLKNCGSELQEFGLLGLEGGRRTNEERTRELSTVQKMTGKRELQEGSGKNSDQVLGRGAFWLWLLEVTRES